MAANPRITRLTLVPHSGRGGELRRYRLARMDEIALATPPDPSVAARREAPAEPNGGPPTPAGERAPRA